MKGIGTIGTIGALVVLGGCSPFAEFTGKSETFTLASDNVGDDFEIGVYLPRDYEEDERDRPVVYVLDGAVQGEPTAGLAEVGRLDVVVVGIGYDDGFSVERRVRDYTPTVDDNYPMSGGAEEFRQFVVEELFPRIEEDYRVDPSRRSIVGHSQGGNGAIGFALAQDPEAPWFRAIAAVSPALWWDEGVLLDHEEDYASEHEAMPVRLFISVAELDPVPIWGYGIELGDRIEARGYEGLELRREQYDRVSHDMAWVAAYEDALEFLHGR